ncbi:c-type cytochrome [Pseudoroseomonas wenyumeiae]
MLFFAVGLRLDRRRNMLRAEVTVPRLKTLLLGAAGAIVLAGAGFAALAWKPALDPVTPPTRESFPPELIRRGAELAAIGDCNTCHTAPGGKVFAGGLALPTPFGTVYSTNITPDPETGIGRWSEAAFQRAMREGVDREGSHLYPAFPYDHFTLVTEADNRAIYAYLMTREPVRAETPANELVFPLGFRPLLAGWKLLFLKEGPRPELEADHGAYLAEGLGHCGACHSPRNALGAVQHDHALSGGEAEGWYAYAVNQSSPAPQPWTEESLFHYLRHGWEASHGIARGPMAPVVANLAWVPEEDVRAIAGYVARRMGQGVTPATVPALTTPVPGPGTSPTMADSQTVPPVPGQDAGRAVYASACASCHEAGRPLPFGGMHLKGSTAPHGPNPRNLINVVLDGLPAAEGERAPIMPGFRAVLTDQQIVELLGYIRAAFTDQQPWTGWKPWCARCGGAIRPRPPGPPMPCNPPLPTRPSEACHGESQGKRPAAFAGYRPGNAAALRAAG